MSQREPLCRPTLKVEFPVNTDLIESQIKLKQEMVKEGTWLRPKEKGKEPGA